MQEGQLRDVYTGGRQESAVAANIERALTQRDEFGRIMTPKERFRVLNYGCVRVYSLFVYTWYLPRTGCLPIDAHHDAQGALPRAQLRVRACGLSRTGCSHPIRRFFLNPSFLNSSCRQCWLDTKGWLQAQPAVYWSSIAAA